MASERVIYDNRLVRNFALATIVWGVVGMLVGLLLGLQLIWPVLNANLPFLTFSRLRPLHTNAVIFAFVGNAIFMGLYYSLQRLCKARTYSNLLGSIHFWGWQLIIVAAAVSFVSGITTSKEYAELEWPIDIAITIVWVVFAVNMFGTIIRRREQHMYVAIWFYIATVVTVAVLHIGNSIELPVNWLKSYPVYAGVQDALVQWWYAHNAVAFFLTTPFLGLMYYYLPKAANRPVYSYRLSIIHFWALIFIYIWAGPHHLLYTALPDWAQSLGTVFSVMLLAPSWGGMINGLLTLRGAWDKVREDPVLKFLVVAVTAYGMATFEGPALSLKNVNALMHYTDWIIAHVHVGALGWNGFMTFGILYWLVPRLWNTSLFSRKLANLHFWLGTLGIVFYAVAMYTGGLLQSLMWKQFTSFGALQYPNFLETTQQIIPMYMIRALGGVLYIGGVVVMLFNLGKTMRGGSFVPEEQVDVPPGADQTGHNPTNRHRWLEKRPAQFALLATAVILVGGLAEIVPAYLIKSNVPTITSVKPYSPLELQGRDLYIREGCNGCHSQMVRPFRSETERYGEYSKAGEYVYDHPFLWGSKRTGPDLHRVGGKYNNLWHYLHMNEPPSTSPGSIMPGYPWFLTDDLDTTTTGGKIVAMQKLGVPYPAGYELRANGDLRAQAEAIANDLQMAGAPAEPQKEIMALIAYLQRLGTDIKAKEGE